MTAVRGPAVTDRHAVDVAGDGDVLSLEVLVRLHPLDEPEHAQLVRTLAERGRYADALAVYAGLRERLRQELDREPSPELSRLQQEVLSRAVAVPSGRHAGIPGQAGAVVEPMPAPRVSAPPPALTSLVGREEDLAALDALLPRTRVVTLHGPGGVGKTRVALAAASRNIGRHPGGVIWVELAPLRDPDALRYAVADALGVRELEVGDPIGTLARALGDAPALLVLDNCEHLVDAAADLVDGLVRRCPAVSVLTTSREPLAVPGEQLVPVAPLAAAADGEQDPAQLRELPAVRLLGDRLAAARGRALEDADLPHAAALARRLDGLPLALELAAGRAAALGLPQLAERAGLDVLDRGLRTGDARHRSLRAVVAWSYDLLDEAERLLFARLSVFAGPVPLGRVEAVCSDERVLARRVGALLADLVDRSLVVGARNTADGRYRLLATLGEFAAERLEESGETERWQRRHALHLTDVASAAAGMLHGAAEAAAMERLTDDLDDLRAAHEAARRTGDVDTALRLSDALHDFASRQLRHEVFGWAQEAVAMPGAEGHRLYPAVLGSAAKGAWLRGELQVGRDRARRALAACPDEQDARRVRPLLALAEVSLVSGRLDEALTYYRRAVDLARRAEDSGAAVDAAGGLAMTLADSGRPVEALAAAQECDHAATATGAPTHRAWASYAEARCRAAARPEVAAELLERAGEFAVAAGNRSIELSGLTRMLAIRGRLGDPEEQLHAYRDALERWRRSGSSTFLRMTLRNLAELLQRVGQPETALALRAACDRALPEAGDAAASLDAALALALRAIADADADADADAIAIADADGGAGTGPGATADPGSGAREALVGLPAQAQASGKPRTFRRTGELWLVSFAGLTAHVPDRKGLRDLAVLLGRPGEEVHCLDLLLGSAPEGVREAGEVLHAPGDLGEVLDATARTAYKERITQLRQELDDADATGDAGRAARTQHELDLLTAELAAAYGLGGRARRTGDPVEKARAAVTWRIRHAIGKVAQVHPQLGQHLRRDVRTGRYCAYEPDESVAWRL